MSTSDFILLSTLLLVSCLSFRLLIDRGFYLQTARNKSDIGYLRWWFEKNIPFLANSMATYLVVVLLFVLADRRNWPPPLTATLAVALLLVSLWVRDARFRRK